MQCLKRDLKALKNKVILLIAYTRAVSVNCLVICRISCRNRHPCSANYLLLATSTGEEGEVDSPVSTVKILLALYM